MAHSENFLRRVIWVQDIVIQYRKKGVSDKWVYYNVIENTPPFISYETFRKYMCINAKAELKELKNEYNTIKTNG
jgi:hypothetical protein